MRYFFDIRDDQLVPDEEGMILPDIEAAQEEATRTQMSDFDLAIRGGTVVTASDTFRADVGVRAGRIVALAAEIDGASREIDASGLLVLPGGIDSHVHIAQPSSPGVVMADDFASATAAAGGNTCIMPFALQQRGTSLRLPTLYSNRSFADAGGFASYGGSSSEAGRQGVGSSKSRLIVQDQFSLMVSSSA
jgi:hypothetical protein